MSTSKRACTGTTRKGKPCKAAPLKDRDVCLAHADKALRDSTGFGITGGRPKKPRMVDLIRERMEADLDAWYSVLEGARTATSGVTIKLADGETEFFETPDHTTRLAAFREAMDRSYGRPKQATEISGPEGAPITLEAPADHADRATRAARLLHDAGLLQPQPALNGSNGNGHAANGNGNGHH